MEMTSDGATPAGDVTVTTGDDGTVEIALSGEIDLANVGDIADLVRPALDAGSRVVLDLDAVTFMDTSGIAMLLDFANTVSSTSVTTASKQVRRVLEASGLSGVLGMGT